jgi:hypothetical protein
MHPRRWESLGFIHTWMFLDIFVNIGYEFEMLVGLPSSKAKTKIQDTRLTRESSEFEDFPMDSDDPDIQCKPM